MVNTGTKDTNYRGIKLNVEYSINLPFKHLNGIPILKTKPQIRPDASCFAELNISSFETICPSASPPNCQPYRRPTNHVHGWISVPKPIFLCVDQHSRSFNYVSTRNSRIRFPACSQSKRMFNVHTRRPLSVLIATAGKHKHLVMTSMTLSRTRDH